MNFQQNTNQQGNTMGQNQNQASLSSKNLTILEDQLNYEALNCKKLNVYSDSVNDSELKNVCQKAARMHKQHFDSLFNYLNSHNKPLQ